MVRFIFSLTLAAALLPAACGPDRDVNAKFDGVPDHWGAEVVIKDFERFNYKKKKKQWRLKSDIAMIFSEVEVHDPTSKGMVAEKVRERRAKRLARRKANKDKIPPNMRKYSFVYEEDVDFENTMLHKLFEAEERIFDLRRKTVMINVDLEQYRKGKWHSRVRSKYGYLDSATNDLHLEGDVVVKTQDGRTLKAPYLNYNRYVDKVHTMAPVYIDSEDGIIQGVGLVANADLTWIQILNPAGITDGGGKGSF